MVMAAWTVAATASAVIAHRNGDFTLRHVDTCFLAPPVPNSYGWPVGKPFSPHPIRGSFNEPRGSGVHFGVDVQAIHDETRVYAIAPGRVLAWAPRGRHFAIGPTTSSFYSYWHVIAPSGFRVGESVAHHQVTGHVLHAFYHVHISEYHQGCGWIDPRRPTGALHNPTNREQPTIGSLSAYRATGAAFASLHMTRDPATLSDHSTPLPLDDLHGAVDLRAVVVDVPTVQMRGKPQLALSPAAIRAYLAPIGHRHFHFRKMRHIFDGARLLQPSTLHTTLWRIWAFGTYRQSACYYTIAGPCGADIVWHVGGHIGLNTHNYPNGAYQYCIQAMTINGVRAHRCTPVRLQN